MGTFSEEYKKLNAAQRHAVDTIEGPVLVIAGPGTGKTQLLSMRVANILNKTDASPSNILCLTFTDAAARNMRERLAGLIGESAYHVSIHTFHSFGSDIIQRFPEYFLDEPLIQPVETLGAYELLLDIFKTLPNSNPLHKILGDEYLHIFSAQSAISWLKQAGIDPKNLKRITKANDAFIGYIEPEVEKCFRETPSPQNIAQYEKLLQKIRDFSSPENDASLAELMGQSLSDAISETPTTGRYAKPITEWRNKWLVQNQLKTWVLADRRKNKFAHALATVYEQYQKALKERGWYTFDDMILRTIKALEEQTELRLTLQEQYQYILVDEYQDTNGAQNQLLELLADSPVNEGRPNLMVVGDDDQAIYRFQGADLSVMLDFIERWRNVEQIVLTDNYRSADPILKLSRHVITQGEDRLENRIASIDKSLRSGLGTQPKAEIIRPESVSELDHYAATADTIATLIKSGTKPSDVAVLAPKHSYLTALVPYMIDRGIPISYERREHILEQPRIIELVDLAELIHAAMHGNWDKVDEYLPKVLSADYWQISAVDLWQLSIEAYDKRKRWIDCMLSHKDSVFDHFAQAIIVLAKEAQHQPLETVIDALIGNQSIMLNVDTPWHIPYRSYYFSEKELAASPQAYFTLLGQLTSLREKIREYQPGRFSTLDDFIHFVHVYKQSKLPLIDTNPHTLSNNAVELMTAYKAKGLEWDTVFVLGCHNNIWGTKARSTNYSFSLPSNLAWIKPARDSHDDRLRLFYVALTRAKTRLFLTCFKQSMNGKSTEPVGWLTSKHPSIPAVSTLKVPYKTDLIRTQEIQWGMTRVQQSNLHDTLHNFLDSYHLSATHVSSFLDITKGGPKNFFFTHILHFPQTLQPSAVFGATIHGIIHYLHTEFTRNGTLPTKSVIHDLVRTKLEQSVLLANDRERLTERGITTIDNFYRFCGPSLQVSDKSEYSFAKDEIVIDTVRLTGTLDVLRRNEDGDLVIIDYKTGAPMHNWRGTQGYGQIRAHLYRQQLAFYYLLVRGSAQYSKHNIANGIIQFVEADDDGEVPQLSYHPDKSDMQRLERLIKIVWQHIQDLNFPDTSSYTLDIKGIKQFEEDLLNGTI